MIRRILMVIAIMFGAVALSACASGENIRYIKTEALGLDIRVDPSTGMPGIMIGQGGMDFADVPVTMETNEGQVALRGSRRQHYENGQPSLEIEDASSVCGAFGGIADAGQSGNIVVDKVFATGSAAQAVCDGIAAMYATHGAPAANQ